MSVDDTHTGGKKREENDRTNNQLNDVYFHRFGIGVRHNIFILSFCLRFPISFTSRGMKSYGFGFG